VIKTVLMALDGSELSAYLLTMLNQISLVPETTIVLAHVIADQSESLDIASDRPPTDTADPSEKYLIQMQQYQERLPRPASLEVVHGDPAEEIVRLAHLHRADLIIMGSRGLTGLERVLHGSVSSQVVADAPCSVLVVKPD
jgi:nucleotide-binding universal stress UspA family protein